MTSRVVLLDEQALALAGASDLLALDGAVLGRGVALQLSEVENGLFAVDPSEPGGPPSDVSDPVADRVAVVSIMGPIAQRSRRDMCAYVDGYDSIERRLAAALDDPESGSVLLRIDSPGGDVAGCFSAIERMRAAVEASGKPCISHAEECATSAAYGLAVGVADEFTLPSTGRAASVGVLSVYLDNSEALAQKGIKPTIIRSGLQKADASGVEPLSATAFARIKASVDSAANEFAGIVARRRGLTTAAVLAHQGATMGAQQAVNAGLADGILSFDKAVKRAATLARERRMTIGQQGAAGADIAKLGAVEAQMNELIRAAGAESFASALGKIESGKAALEKLAAVEAERTALLAAAAARAKVDAVAAVMSAPEHATRVTPGNKARLEAFGAKYGPDELAAYIADLPEHAANKDPEVKPAGGAVMLTEEDKAVARSFGKTDVEWLEIKRADAQSAGKVS